MGGNGLDGRVVTKYIGPLEELVRIYQIYRLKGQANYRITHRDIRRITDGIAESVVNLLEKRLETMVRGVGFEPTQAYATGSSTRRPMSISSGSRYKVNYSHMGPVRDNSVLRRFLEWCMDKGTSESTCIQYKRYLEKPLDMNNKWSRLAYKAFYKFMGWEDLWKQIRVKHSGVDLYVPSDEQVMETLRKACSSSTELCTLYKVLLESGLRIKEAAKLISEQDPSKWISLDGFYKYPLSWIRAKKRAFYAYVVEIPPRMSVSDKWIRNWASKNNVVAGKYIRKWVATKMLSLGIPEEIVNFIQGRTPSQILSKHYLKLSTLADQYYKKYTDWIRKVIT